MQAGPCLLASSVPVCHSVCTMPCGLSCPFAPAVLSLLPCAHLAKLFSFISAQASSLLSILFCSLGGAEPPVDTCRPHLSLSQVHGISAFVPVHLPHRPRMPPSSDDELSKPYFPLHAVPFMLPQIHLSPSPPTSLFPGPIPVSPVSRPNQS